jgi:hypothetical protein
MGCVGWIFLLFLPVCLLSFLVEALFGKKAPAGRGEYIDKRIRETGGWPSARQAGYLESAFGAEYDEIRGAGWDEGFRAGRAAPDGAGKGVTPPPR